MILICKVLLVCIRPICTANKDWDRRGIGFVLEKPNYQKPGLLFHEKKQTQWMSKTIRGAMSSGRESVHTRVSLQFLAFLASASATKLQCLVLKINSKEERAATWVRISSIMWPYIKWLELSWVIVWITWRESPSKTTSWRPNSTASCTAQRQAKASNSTTDWATRIDVDNAPIASPRQSRMITPIPARLQDLKTVTSKLALNLFSSGGCHCWGKEGLVAVGVWSRTSRNS